TRLAGVGSGWGASTSPSPRRGVSKDSSAGRTRSIARSTWREATLKKPGENRACDSYLVCTGTTGLLFQPIARLIRDARQHYRARAGADPAGGCTGRGADVGRDRSLHRLVERVVSRRDLAGGRSAGARCSGRNPALLPASPGVEHVLAVRG